MGGEIILSTLAKRDLDGIADYTLEHWGSAKFVEYNIMIANAFEQIAQYPNFGRVIENMDYRSMNVGSHMVICRAKPKPIMILRILHHHVLMSQHLTH